MSAAARRRSPSDALAAAVRQRGEIAVGLTLAQGFAAAADRELARAVRRWGKQTYGSVSALAAALAARTGLDDEYVRTALYRPTVPVLDEAVAMWREADAQSTHAVRSDGSPAPRATTR